MHLLYAILEIARKTSKLKAKRVCYACGSDKTYTAMTKERYPNPHWYNNEPIGWLCEVCKNRYIKNPRRICYFDKRIPLSNYPRKGVCLECGKSVITTEVKRTNMHHALGYFPIFVWFGILELCVGCHDKKR